MVAQLIAMVKDVPTQKYPLTIPSKNAIFLPVRAEQMIAPMFHRGGKSEHRSTQQWIDHGEPLTAARISRDE